MNISKNKNLIPMKFGFTKVTHLALAFVFMFAANNALQATHIVGGDITYKCLGWSNYEVTLTVRRDCEFGEEPFDATAHVGIFDGYGNLLPWFGTGGMIKMQDPVVDTINTDLDQGDCPFIGEPVCVNQAVYKGIINLPRRASGYYFAYQRCCRNESLTNIVMPLNNGSTYFVRLLEEEMGEECNSAPYFNNWPDIYICTNQTLVFDHSATDDDGDSLAYKLCTPSIGATFDLPQPVPPAGPPYVDVMYENGFSFDDPMGGVPLTIDVNTGIMTAVPDAIGQWLIGVCVEEWKDGVLLTTVKRDFEYNTRICVEGPMALFEAPDPFCEGLEFAVNNTSTDADSYEWSVVPSDGVVFDANAVNPTFTFPANGTYTISLEAFRDIDGCSNIFSQEVGVYDSQLEAAFTATIESCAGDSTIVTLVSTSTDPDYDIISWAWNATAPGFDANSIGETTTITVPTVDNVVITLVVTSSNNCSEMATQNFDADPLDLELIANPMSICQGESLDILVNPNCDLTYTIEPLDYVTFDDPDDPCVITVSPLEVITYTVTATDGICTAMEMVTVDVIEKADLEITGDSISCDGNIQLTVVGGLPGNQYEWSTNADFDPLIGDMTDVLNYVMTSDTQTIYVRVKEGTGCSDVVSYNIYNYPVDISYPSEVVVCTTIDEEIIVVNNDESQEITIVWDENEIIVMTTDSSVIINTDDPNINTVITFTATNQYGCTEMGEIQITAEQIPELDFSWDITCGTLELCFTNLTDPIDGEYIWDFGDLTTEDDVSTETSPCYTYPEAGVYDVTLTINGGACQGQTITKTVNVPVVPEIEIDSEDLELCLNETVTLTATTNVVDGMITWTDSNGDIGTGVTIDYTATESTVITVTVVDSAGCEATDMINIDVYVFDLSIDVPEINCVGDEVLVTLTNNSAGDDFTYDWEPGACIVDGGDGGTTATISADDTKTITIFITNNENGCDTLFSFDFNVSVIDKSVVVDIENPYQCAEITVSVEPDLDGCTYLWETGETESVITDTILQETTYTVTITDDNGCTAVESLTVPVQLPECDETDVYLPNAFSPNNDNNNDVLFVRSNFVKSMDLVIYDRWGEMIFQSKDIDTGWDGTFNGTELAPDVYAYCLLATCSNGENYMKTGNITLIR